MSLGHAVHLAPRSVSRAFSRGIHATAFTVLIGAISIALAFQIAWPSLVVWPAVIALLPMGAALYLLDRWRTHFFAIAYLVVGGASTYWYCLTLATQIELTPATTAITVALPKVALVLIGGSGVGIRAGLRWCTIGFFVAEAASLVATLQSGGRWEFDDTTTAAWVVMILLLILVHTGNRRTERNLSLLHSAARDELVAALRHRIELKAAALLHDTILSHLSAVAGSTGKTLNPVLVGQIQRDVAVLVGEEWLRDSAPFSSIDEDSDWRATQLYEAVREARTLGLEVETTGESNAVMRLNPLQSTALGLAVKQCLVNVLRHSGTTDAEVAVYDSPDELLVMVVDSGSGFTEADTGSDRLGLKTSVRGRIEEVGGSVQIWSTPGRGTSVVMRIPVASVPSSDGQHAVATGATS